MFETVEGFERVYGSKGWPTEDPGASPDDTFVCSHCGFKFTMRMWGSFGLNENPGRDAMMVMAAHRGTCRVVD